MHKIAVGALIFLGISRYAEALMPGAYVYDIPVEKRMGDRSGEHLLLIVGGSPEAPVYSWGFDGSRYLLDFTPLVKQALPDRLILPGNGNSRAPAVIREIKTNRNPLALELKCPHYEVLRFSPIPYKDEWSQYVVKAQSGGKWEVMYYGVDLKTKGPSYFMDKDYPGFVALWGRTDKTFTSEGTAYRGDYALFFGSVDQPRRTDAGTQSAFKVQSGFMEKIEGAALKDGILGFKASGGNFFFNLQKGWANHYSSDDATKLAHDFRGRDSSEIVFDEEVDGLIRQDYYLSHDNQYNEFVGIQHTPCDYFLLKRVPSFLIHRGGSP
ncbi:MAG: hypothetical protein HY552_00825 [Elusimicrobia bacterium]|nr:hypothetical protein [Elusimicrobiota bacterium]